MRVLLIFHQTTLAVLDLEDVSVSWSLGSLTPKWEDVGSSRGDADKEMAQVTFHSAGLCFVCLCLLFCSEIIYNNV